MLRNYTFDIRDKDDAVFQGGEVMASDDRHAIIGVAQAVRCLIADCQGMTYDHVVSITKPDGTALGAPAIVAEFLKT